MGDGITRVIHILTQWYILYPLLAYFIFWAIKKNWKKRG